MLQQRVPVLIRRTWVTIGYSPIEIASLTEKEVFYNSDNCVWYNRDCQFYPEGSVLQQWQLAILPQRIPVLPRRKSSTAVTVGYVSTKIASLPRRKCSTTETGMIQHRLLALLRTCSTTVTVRYSPTEIASPPQKGVFYNSEMGMLQQRLPVLPRRTCSTPVTVGYASTAIASPSQNIFYTHES